MWDWTRVTGAIFAISVIVASGLAGGAKAKGREVRADFDYPPGTMVIVNNERRLYFIKGKGRG